MPAEIEICTVCAWRATCQKKFSLSGRDIHCPDFTRDVCIKTDTEDHAKQEERKK